MKHIFALLICFSFFHLNAQKTFSIGPFTAKKIVAGIGYETDMVNNLSYNYFRKQLPQAERDALAGADLSPETLYTGVCENPSFNLGLGLTHPKLRNIEWYNTLAYKPTRVDAVTYRNTSNYSGDYLSFNGTHNELNLETALLYKLSILNFLNIYGGVGANAGFTFNNQTCIFSSVDLTADDISFRNNSEINETLSSNNHEGYYNCINTGVEWNHRAFLQLGSSLQFFNKIELGLDFKFGVGYRANLPDSFTGTRLTSTNLTLKYILNDRHYNNDDWY